MKEGRKSKPRVYLPKGLTLQDEQALPPNYSFGKVFCDRNDCDECEYIQDPISHLLEKVKPILEKLNQDINMIAQIKIAMPDQNNCKRFEVEYPENFQIQQSMFKHFEECHLCYHYWKDESFLDIIGVHNSTVRNTRNKKGPSKRGKK